MVHQTAKNKNALPHQKPLPKLHPADALKEVQEKVQELTREQVENITHVAGEYSHAATESLKKGSEKITTLFASGNKASGALKDINSEIMKSCKQMFSDSVEISKEMLSCRTSKEMIELQSKALQQLCDNYFETANKLRDMTLDLYEEALSSFSDAEAAVTGKVRKARAA